MSTEASFPVNECRKLRCQLLGGPDEDPNCMVISRTASNRAGQVNPTTASRMGAVAEAAGHFAPFIPLPEPGSEGCPARFYKFIPRR